MLRGAETIWDCARWCSTVPRAAFCTRQDVVQMVPSQRGQGTEWSHVPRSPAGSVAVPRIEPRCPHSPQTALLHNCSATPLSCGLPASCAGGAGSSTTSPNLLILRKKKPAACSLSPERKLRFVPFSSFSSSKGGNTPLDGEIGK